MIDNILRILIVGPMGVWKSQFCNFVQRDIANSINKVSDSLESCTQSPKSNKFKRIETNFDFIDTAGSNDSDEIDIANLETLVNYLKKLKVIHYIILVLRFGERFTGDTKQYIEALGKIFTVREFFCHLSIVFTKYPNEPKEQDLKAKDTFNKEINKLLRKIFQPKEIDNLPDNDIYYIDTTIDKENENNNQKNQEIVDKILKKIILTQNKNKPINTENLDITGKNAKLRRELELELLKKQLEEEKRQKELAQQQAREYRIRQEAYESANAQLRNALKKIEQNKYEIYEKERDRIDQMRRNLNNMNHYGSNLAEMGKNLGLGGLGMTILGGIITPVCPVLGPVLVATGIGSTATGVGGVGLGAKIAIDSQREQIKLEEEMYREEKKLKEEMYRDKRYE